MRKKEIFSKFSCFYLKYLFYCWWSWYNMYQIYTRHSHWTNLIQKTETVSLSCNLAPRLIQVCSIQWWFLFWTGNTFFGKIWLKHQSFQFRLTLGTKNKSNMKNSMVMFTSFVSNWKNPFRGSLVQKIIEDSSTWNLLLRLFKYPEFSGDVHFICF